MLQARKQLEQLRANQKRGDQAYLKAKEDLAKKTAELEEVTKMATVRDGFLLDDDNAWGLSACECSLEELGMACLVDLNGPNSCIVLKSAVRICRLA